MNLLAFQQWVRENRPRLKGQMRINYNGVFSGRRVWFVYFRSGAFSVTGF